MNESEFWLVWNQQGRAPTYKHTSYEGAKIEAERLARTVGGEYYVLHSISVTKRVDVVTSNMVSRDSDELPY